MDPTRLHNSIVPTIVLGQTIKTETANQIHGQLMAKPERPDYTSGRTQMSSFNRSGQSYNINGQSQNDEQTQDTQQNFQDLASEDRRDI